MKKHNLFKVVMITLGIVVLLSWLLSTTSYSNGSLSVAKNPIGIFSIGTFVIVAIQYLCYLPFYILIVGGLYGVLHKIPGYRNLLETIVKGFRDREWLFMSIVMVVFAVLSSMVGFSQPLLVLFPFVISVILMMGYDKITAAMVTVGSVTVGLIGSVFSLTNVYQISYWLTTSPNDDVVTKILILVICLIVLMVNTFIYAKKHRDTKHLAEGSYIPSQTNKKMKIWPIVLVIDLLLVVLALSYFSWDLFEISFFEDVLKDINNYKIGEFAIFKSILGLPDTSYFGVWGLVECSTVIVLASLLLSFVYKMKFSDYVTNFMNGAKRALKPAVLVLLAFSILVAVENHPITLTICKPLLELTESVNAATMSVVAFLTSILHIDVNYSAASVLPYVTSLYSSANLTESASLLSVIWQSMYGLAMLVGPTSVVLLATLGYLHVPYGKWLKSVALLFFELLVVLSLIFLVLSFI